jgi:hypothetical protein
MWSRFRLVAIETSSFDARAVALMTDPPIKGQHVMSDNLLNLPFLWDGFPSD